MAFLEKAIPPAPSTKLFSNLDGVWMATLTAE